MTTAKFLEIGYLKRKFHLPTIDFRGRTVTVRAGRVFLRVFLLGGSSHLGSKLGSPLFTNHLGPFGRGPTNPSWGTKTTTIVINHLQQVLGWSSILAAPFSEVNSLYLNYLTIPWKFNSSPLKIYNSKRKGLSSNHHFSGASYKLREGIR